MNDGDIRGGKATWPWLLVAPVFRKALFASSIVSARTLSVSLATGFQNGSWAFRSAQMISNCWSSVWNSESEKPTLCIKLENYWGKYQLLTMIFLCPANGIATANFSSVFDSPAVG